MGQMQCSKELNEGQKLTGEVKVSSSVHNCHFVGNKRKWLFCISVFIIHVFPCLFTCSAKVLNCFPTHKSSAPDRNQTALNSVGIPQHTLGDTQEMKHFAGGELGQLSLQNSDIELQLWSWHSTITNRST